MYVRHGNPLNTEGIYFLKGTGQNLPPDKDPLRPKPPSGQNPPPAKTPFLPKKPSCKNPPLAKTPLRQNAPTGKKKKKKHLVNLFTVKVRIPNEYINLRFYRLFECVNNFLHILMIKVTTLF